MLFGITSLVVSRLNLQNTALPGWLFKLRLIIVQPPTLCPRCHGSTRSAMLRTLLRETQ